MKHCLFAILLIFCLNGCASGPAPRSPAQMAHDDAEYQCIKKNLQGKKLQSCTAKRYAELLPQYQARYDASWQQYKASQEAYARSLHRAADDLDRASNSSRTMHCRATPVLAGTYLNCH